MAQKVWTVQLPDGAHIVELQHGTKSGKRELRVDGALVDLGMLGRKFVDTGSVHPFSLAGRPCEVQIQPRGLGSWYYSLKVDGESLDPPMPPRRTPAWAALFVFVCLAPTLQLLQHDVPIAGLLVTLAVGLGGTVGCLAIASDTVRPTDQRVIRCILLSAGILFVMFLPRLLIQGAILFLQPRGNL
jgi:hypothetical protein